MIHLFRSIIFSKIGGGVTIAFLVLIAFAFAAGDVLNFGHSGTIQSSDEVAKVGSHKITAAEYEKAITNAFESEKQSNPQLSLKAFVAAGGADQVLTQLIDRAAILEFGQKHGLVAGDRLIDSEIAKLPVAQGADGRFNQKVYEQMLAQRGLTDKAVRDDFTASLVARQVLVPASFGAPFPEFAAVRYASLLREQRKGAIALLPSASFAPKAPPSDAEVAAFYNKTRNNYLLPERRVIRYATFDAGVVKAAAAPTEAEVAARYNADKAQYAASETRRIVQLVVPTEAAARAILAETGKGVSLEQAARAKGLATSGLAAGKAALVTQASQAVADAAYGAKAGTVVGPARSGLGWHLLRVDAIDNKPARSLEQVRGEITAALAEQKQRAALSDFSARIEEEFDNGSALSDVAKELAVTPSLTEPVTGDGKVFGKAGQTVPTELARIVPAAFAMDRENKPQLAEIEPGKKFMVYDVTKITPAAPAPLAEIRDAVIGELQLEKGQVVAKAAAERVLAATKKGTPLAAAVSQLALPGIPPVDQVDMNRQELTAKPGQQIPPPLALLFSMAQGTVKLYPAPRNRGWYLIGVSQILPATVAASDPMIPAARKELGALAGREYADLLRRAIRAEVGVTRKDSAVKAAQAQVTGGN
ncbi:MAG: SurA N-terminal domain-containing protein [Novosphingobium sp.]